MEERNLLASKKLHLMWKGNLISLIGLVGALLSLVMLLLTVLSNPFAADSGLVFALLSLVGAVTVMVGSIMSLVGLYGLRPIHDGYRTAFQIEIALMILGLVIRIIFEKGTFGYDLMEAVRTIIALGVTWFVIKATGALMTELGRQDMIEFGRKVWLINIISTVLGSVVLFLPSEGNTPPLLMVLMIGILILSIAAMWFYLRYLKGASAALEESESQETASADIDTPHFPGKVEVYPG